MVYKNEQKRFLLIDDVMNNLITLKALILETFPNSEVAIAQNGELGLQLARRIQPDVILLDILMPHMDGFEVCKAIKADSDLQDIPVLFVTALKSDKENRMKALACGGEAFLTKPVDDVDLYVQLRSMLKIREKNRNEKAEKERLQELVAARTHELEKLKEKYKGLLDDLPGAVCEYLPDSTLTYVNEAYTVLHNRSAGELIGQKFLDYVDPTYRARVERSYRFLTPGQPANVSVEKIQKDGNALWMEWRNRAIFDEQGRVSQYYSIGLDITERKKSEQRLVFLSYHDYLTGLYNRRFFEEEMKRLNQPRNLPLTIVMADVNGLKLVNDSFGHKDGDRLLQNVANSMKRGFRADDIIARIGGDEFAVILTNTDTEVAEEVVLRAKEQIKKHADKNMLHSVSFGFATKTRMEEDINEIFTTAENFMYRHKVYESASMRSKIVGLIMTSLFEKSEREMSHSARVGEMAASIARVMGFSDEHISEIRTAGYIHDIGKIGVHEKILNKDGSLTEEEWVEMKKHPEAGRRILSSVDEFKMIAEHIVAHHERWDGKGYPNNLAGEEIPIEARIIAVADSFDAMTSKRSYRKPMPRQEALDEVVRNSGTQFDPDVVEAFLKIDIPSHAETPVKQMFRIDV